MDQNTEVVDETPALFQTQRQQAIVALVKEHGRAEVSDLAERFKVTTETIRRDLSELQEAEVLRRVHGGAVPWTLPSSFEPLLTVRTRHNRDEKTRLARRALTEIPWGGTVIFDSGSTVGTMAEILPDRALRVVTNSLVDAQLLAERKEVDTSVLGGTLRKNTLAMVDAETVRMVEALKVDTLFISADAASARGALSTPYRGEAALKAAMINSARRVVALVDHTKFGQDQLIRFADWDSIDLLITNHELDSAIVSTIEAAGTDVALC